MSFNQTAQHGFCSNCGRSGHTFRQCVEPVSSYGVLVFRWISRSPSWIPSSEFCKDNRNPTGIVNMIPEVLMIQRKDSLGFMDIMRGKYTTNDPEYIKKQLKGMTNKERQRLLNDDFDEIWNDIWVSDLDSSNRYIRDKMISKQKLAELRTGVELANGTKYTLADLLRQEPGFFETPEWGFPKGRRNPHESDIQCAFRELGEETGICDDELLRANNVLPFVEQFYGSNDIHYRHSYYLAQYVGDREISFDVLNTEMTREIGDMSWKSLDEALILLRPENIEKRGILIQLASLLRNYVPIFRDTLIGRRLESGNKNKLEEQECYVFSSSRIRTRTDGSAEVAGGVEKPTRLFGTRQTYRRIPELCCTNQGEFNERFSSRTEGDRGVFVPGYKRHDVPIKTSKEEGVP